MKFLLVAVNAKYIHSNPAVHLLRAYAGVFKENITIREFTINQRKEEILAAIFEEHPDILAFSCYIWNREIISSLLRALPKILPAIPVFLGGPEVSYDAPEVLKAFPEVKGIMVGEGENTFRELAAFYLKAADVSKIPESLSGIAGLCLPGKDGSPAFFTPERLPLSMDDIPFIYEEYRNAPELGPFKNKILYYETSRGCPFRCSYCLSSIDKTLRLRSLEKVFSELQFFLDRKVPQVKLIDRTFNCNHAHALSIWKYLKDHDNGVTNFHFEIAGDLLTEEEITLLNSLRPGFVQLEIGVQSTNPLTLEEIQRVTDMEKLRKNVAALKSARNIHLHLDLIAGLPFENLESFKKSFNDLFQMSPDELQLGFLKVLHGTVMEEKQKTYHLKALSEPPYEVLSTDWLSYEDLLKLKKVEEMLELYYNSGQFTTTLAVLIPLFGTPYAFFEALAAYYEREGLFLQSPARSYRYEALLRFSVERFPEKETLLKELLTYDLYLRENLKSRPGFLKDLTPYKEALASLEKNKKDHIEVFFHPVHQALKLKIAELSAPKATPYLIRFLYDERNPLNHNAKTEEAETVFLS